MCYSIVAFIVQRFFHSSYLVMPTICRHTWAELSCLPGLTENTRRPLNVGLMLPQRQRRWTNINPALGNILCLLWIVWFRSSIILFYIAINHVIAEPTSKMLVQYRTSLMSTGWDPSESEPKHCIIALCTETVEGNLKADYGSEMTGSGTIVLALGGSAWPRKDGCGSAETVCREDEMSSPTWQHSSGPLHRLIIME